MTIFFRWYIVTCVYRKCEMFTKFVVIVIVCVTVRILSIGFRNLEAFCHDYLHSYSVKNPVISCCFALMTIPKRQDISWRFKTTTGNVKRIVLNQYGCLNLTRTLYLSLCVYIRSQKPFQWLEWFNSVIFVECSFSKDHDYADWYWVDIQCLWEILWFYLNN